MFDVNLEQFWKDDTLAHEENCFSKKAPQVALGIRMSDECVFAELGEEGSPWGKTPRQRRIELNRRYNDKAEKIVGRRLLREDYPLPEEAFPAIRRIGEIFGGTYSFDGNTEWLHSDMTEPEELEERLDWVDNMDFRSFVLPENWESEKKRIYESFGKRPSPLGAVRGPVTLATSILGAENFIFLMVDAPELAKRFSDTIARVICQYEDLLNAEAGNTEETRPHSFEFYDDDCALLGPEMYWQFGYPVLEKVFRHVCPNPGDYRFQHSDSAMSQHLPALAKLNLTACNFGPTLTVREIRAAMPHTRIDGQLAPFTFMRNNAQDIIAEVKRDCEMAKEGDLRGVNLSTAGSINNGSSLESMRAVMYAIQQYGRY